VGCPGRQRVDPTNGSARILNVNRARSPEQQPFIERTGGLHGLILESPSFPGWENLGAAVRHFRFVRGHHQKIKRVAVVTNSRLGDAAEHIASHFVAATIRG